ncbi:hypothetical protein D9M73_126680 [compost metagenome]
MRFLRVLGLGLVDARLVGNVARIIAIGDGMARGRDRARIHLHAVGPHVGDRAILIEALRDPHRVVGGEAELARGLLLQRRGGEGRWRVARRGLHFDGLDGEQPAFDRGLGALGSAFLADRQPIKLLALEGDEAGLERRAVMLHVGGDRPIFLRAEGLDLALTADDQAQRDRLHTARRLGTGQLAPQNG